MLWTSPRHDRKLPTKGRHSCLFWEGRTVMLSLQTNVPVHGFPLCDNVPSRHAGPWIGVLGTRGAIVVLPSQPLRMERVWSGSQVRAQLPNDVTSLGPHKDKFPRARLKNLVSPRNSSYYGFGKTRAKLLSHMMVSVRKEGRLSKHVAAGSIPFLPTLTTTFPPAAANLPRGVETEHDVTSPASPVLVIGAAQLSRVQRT